MGWNQTLNQNLHRGNLRRGLLLTPCVKLNTTNCSSMRDLGKGQKNWPQERKQCPVPRSVRRDSLAVAQHYRLSDSLIRLIPECFTWDGVKLYFSLRKGRREHLLPLIALTYLTFPDTERWAPALKPLRYVSHNTLTQARSSDSHRGHSQNVLPWWADGNQRKSISNDRLLLSTQLILLVIAVDLIEWLRTLQTLRHGDKCMCTHARTSKYT